MDSKEFILQEAQKLFYSKGYEESSIADILKATSLSKGALYYYFESKEKILDAIIDRIGQNFFSEARHIVQNKKLHPRDRLMQTIIDLMTAAPLSDEELESYHQPQNALLHQKSNAYILENAIPLLTPIIEEGKEMGFFSCPYPREALEMIFLYVNIAFDHKQEDSEEDQVKKIMALNHHVHLLLGAEEGSLPIMDLFQGANKHDQ